MKDCEGWWKLHVITWIADNLYVEGPFECGDKKMFESGLLHVWIFELNTEGTIHIFNYVYNDVAVILFWLMIEERSVIRCINKVCPKFGKRPTLR